MSKDTHSFSVSVACEVGERAAIILQHLCFLQKSNVSADENWQQKWVRRSAAAMAKTYPYWTAKQIAAICDNLEKSEYVFSKIDNMVKTDRAKSYLLTQKGLILMGEIPFSKMGNAFSKIGNASAETENVISQNGEMHIKVDCTSFIPSFIEKKGASLFSFSEREPLEAKKETPPPNSAPPPPLLPPFIYTGETIEPKPALLVRMYDTQLPAVTIVDNVPMTYETTRGKKPTRNAPEIHPENENLFSHFTEPERARAFWGEWLKYKCDEKKQRYKTPQSESAALRRLWDYSHGETAKAGEIIETAIANLWQGFFKLKEEKRFNNKAVENHATLANIVLESRKAAFGHGNG